MRMVFPYSTLSGDIFLPSVVGDISGSDFPNTSGNGVALVIFSENEFPKACTAE